MGQVQPTVDLTCNTSIRYLQLRRGVVIANAAEWSFNNLPAAEIFLKSTLPSSTQLQEVSLQVDIPMFDEGDDLDWGSWKCIDSALSSAKFQSLRYVELALRLGTHRIGAEHYEKVGQALAANLPMMRARGILIDIHEAGKR